MMMMATTSSAVRVGVRVRPLTNQEIGQGGKSVLHARASEVRLGERRFTYDAVFDAHIQQEELYQSVSKPLLISFLEGFNATIMAYGQTGSGKTFTMGSEAHTELELSECTGLIPRFMNDLFQSLQTKKEISHADPDSHHQVLLEYNLQASFLEVYGEDVHDLLDKSRQSLPLREDANGGVVCSGLTHRAVQTANEALQVLHEGTLNRTTAATLMNLTSSRSHAVFTITLTQVHRNDGVDVTSTSRFTFVDLAGSERMKKTGAEGERAREGIKINEGLLALGNVINALADEERLSNGKKVHVPYRQSKLTRLLQDALGGNSQTLFLACVSPSDTNASETLSTLHYANRARNIKNAPVQNVDASTLELQRYKSLTQVLQAELIKSKFSDKENDNDNIGTVDDSLLKREDVVDYLQKLQSTASEKYGSATQHSSLPPSSNSFPPPSMPKHALSPPASDSTMNAPGSDPNKSVLDNYDPALLDEVNPDEEMAILDHLLDIQHHDQEYDKEHKKDDAELKQVEGELAEQEAMLLQLRDSLKVYHNMKVKYEVLMAEVQQLETEKAQLADQLEKASADPSQGCSKAIKKELEKVEKSLARARNETRKHRQMYRKAEQEAQKCRVLERKITDLKLGRANLIKKQKQAAARHREYTEAKTREITALKRKERSTEKRMTKLQNEMQMHKKNLEKRQIYINKLTTKLKQTESHLMKLLSMRQRELHDRTSTIGAGRRRMSILNRQAHKSETDPAAFASSSEEIKSMSFLLDKAVADKVNTAELQRLYEENVAEYSQTMRTMVETVKKLDEAHESNKTGSPNEEAQEAMKELVQSIEELELKAELVGSELESLRSQLADEEALASNAQDDSTTKLIRDKSAPVLRTLLMEMIDKLAESELHRKRFAESIKRKESALQGLETEVETLNTRITAMTKEIHDRRKLADGGDDPVETIQRLESEKTRLSMELKQSQERVAEFNEQVRDLMHQQKSLHTELSKAKEQFTLSEVTLKQREGVAAPSDVLEKMQSMWEELGVSPASRDDVRRQIENCLEDTCARKLEEVSGLKTSTERETHKLRDEIDKMSASLGIDPVQGTSNQEAPLLEQLEILRRRRKDLEPTYASAIERKDELVKHANDLALSMGVQTDDLAPELQALLNQDQSNLEIPCDLSEDFLSRCDREISTLRIKKSEILVNNSKLQKEAYALLNEMNLTEDEVLPLVTHSVRQRLSALPDWWSSETAETIVRAITIDEGVMRATDIFTTHLCIFHESLVSVGKSRGKLSEVFRDIVERAQQTLLKTVDSEVDAIEAYASFHDALFRLPALSKERIHACISEIDALISGVDAMTQSEIEALSVVWEAMNVTMSDRAKFWGDIEDSLATLQSKTDGPFDEVVQLSAVDGEQWVLASVKDATTNYLQLETRLFKLERIHEEVEKLRSRQDAKSRIISLDSEIRILNAKLAEFEDKKCSKQRLLSKKTGSSNLLREERFRKQMQSKFSSKLEQLVALLKTWTNDEGSSFDSNLLSDEVRMLLENSDKMDVLVEQRTAFMHLRTVKAKATPKRGPESLTHDSGSSPARKKRIILPRPPQANEITAQKMRSRSEESKPNTRASSSAANTEQAKKSKPETSLRKSSRIGKLSKTSSESSRPRSPSKKEKKKNSRSRSPAKENKPTFAQSPAKKKTRRAVEEDSRSPLSPARNTQPSKRSTPAKRLTLPPFGHVLEQARTPRNKDNVKTTNSE